MQRGERAADDELGDLQCRQGLLEQARNADVQARQSVVRVHQRVDETVEDAEDPDRGCHVAVRARGALVGGEKDGYVGWRERTGYQPTCRSWHLRGGMFAASCSCGP